MNEQRLGEGEERRELVQALADTTHTHTHTQAHTHHHASCCMKLSTGNFTFAAAQKNKQANCTLSSPKPIYSAHTHNLTHPITPANDC